MNSDLNAEQQVSHSKRACSPDLHCLHISCSVKDEIADFVGELSVPSFLINLAKHATQKCFFAKWQRGSRSSRGSDRRLGNWLVDEVD